MAGVEENIHKLLGNKIEPPINARDLEIDIRFDPDDPHSIPTVELTSIDLSHKEAAIVNKHIEDFGIHTGLPYTHTVSNDTNSILLIDGYLDPAGQETVLGCDKILNIPVVQKKKNDWLVKQSQNVLMNILLSKGAFTTDDYIQVPYIVSTKPDKESAAIATITNFVIGQKMLEISRKIGEVINNMLSVLGAIGAILNLFVIILWVILVIAQIILFLMDIFDHLIQPIKYHAAMSWKQQLEICCEFIGLTFVSSIFDDDDYGDGVIMPAKPRTFIDAKNETALGFTIPDSTSAKGYYKKTFFELLQLTKTTFNAKIILNNDNELIIERVDAPTDPATLTIPNLPLDDYRTNAHEIKGNYEVAFLDDLADNNTIDNYEGTTTNAITTTTSAGIPETQAIEGYLLRQIDLARATRKEGLTNIEKQFDQLFKDFPDQVNKVINAANKVTKARNQIMGKVTKLIKKLKIVGIKINFDPQPIPKLNNITPLSIQKRIGMLVLSNDFFQVDKVMSLDVSSDPSLTKLKVNNDTIWHSETLYNKFHVVQSHAITDEFPFGNQYRRYELDDFRLCLDDVIKIINNNLIFTTDGRQAKIEALTWNSFHGVAKGLKIRIQNIDDPFLETELITEDGL